MYLIVCVGYQQNVQYAPYKKSSGSGVGKIAAGLYYAYFITLIYLNLLITFMYTIL